MSEVDVQSAECRTRTGGSTSSGRRGISSARVASLGEMAGGGRRCREYIDMLLLMKRSRTARRRRGGFAGACGGGAGARPAK